MIKRFLVSSLVAVFFILGNVSSARAVVAEQIKATKEGSGEESVAQSVQANAALMKVGALAEIAVEGLSPDAEFLEFVSNIPRKIKDPLELAISELKDVSPGTYIYEGTRATIDSANNIRLTCTKVSGSSELTLTYANEQLALNGSARVNVGKFISSGFSFSIYSDLHYTGTGQFTLPVIGTTNLSLTGNTDDFTGTVSKSISIAGKRQDVAFTITKGTISGLENFDLPILGDTRVEFFGDSSKLKGKVQAHEITFSGARLDAKSIEVDSDGNVAASGDLYLGTYKFSSATLNISSKGAVTLKGSATVEMSGFAQVFMLNYDGKTITARTESGVKLGGYNFTAAYLEITSDGTVTLAGNPNGSFTISGLIFTFTLKYEKATLYAESTAGISLGSYTYPLAKFVISVGGVPKLTGPVSKTFSVGGISTTYTLNYQNGVLYAESSAGISLGSYNFAGAKFRIDSNGVVTLGGTLTNNFTVAGTTASFGLKYENGVLYAETTAGVSLGTYTFSSAKLKITSNGSLELAGTNTNNFSIGGLNAAFALKMDNSTLYAETSAGITLGGYSFPLAKIKISAGGSASLDGPITQTFTVGGISASYTLKYANNELYAEGDAGISLGSFAFSQARFKISSNGTVTLTGNTGNNLTVAGITTGFTVKFASGVISAESQAGISLGSYSFANAKLVLSSAGAVSLSGVTTSSINVAGASVSFTLKLDNGVLSAESSGGISLGNYSFSSAKFLMSSAGVISLTGNTANNFSIGGLSAGFTLKFENATLYAEGAAGISLGSYSFPQAKFKISAGGIPSLDGTLSKSFTIAGLSVSFTLKYENSELFAESFGGLSLGSYAFSNAKFKITSTGTVLLAGNTSNSFSVYGVNANFTLKYENSILYAESASGVSLGGYTWELAKFKISSAGLPSLEGTRSKTFTIGGVSVTLTLNNDANSLYAEGISNVSLGSYTFSNARFRVSTSGVTATANQNFTVGGKGITFDLSFANGKFGASGTFNVTVAGTGFNNCTATISNTGTVSANGTASVSVPHPCYPKVWNVCYSTYSATLGFENGEFSYSY